MNGMRLVCIFPVGVPSDIMLNQLYVNSLPIDDLFIYNVTVLFDYVCPLCTDLFLLEEGPNLDISVFVYVHVHYITLLQIKVHYWHKKFLYSGRGFILKNYKNGLERNSSY